MIRLLVDCHVFDGKFQGTRTYLEGLYGILKKNNDIDFYFCACDVARLKRMFGESNNIHYIRLRSKNKFLRLLFEYPRIIKNNKIDYAHFQYIVPLIKCCKEIVTIHDLLFLDFPSFFPLLYRLKNRVLFSFSAKRANLLLTVSKFSRSEIEHYFNIPAEKIVITYNSVTENNIQINKNIINKYNIEKFILEVGRIEPRKNQLSLVRAFVGRELYNSYSLVLVGSRDLEYKEYDDYILSLSPFVRSKIIEISVSYEDLISLYRHASLFVFPSFAEGFGIPPLEALVNYCPVLCSRTTAMEEFGFPYKYTFDPYDQEELGNKMEQILKEKYDFSFRNKILAKYSWEESSKILYKSLSGVPELVN